MDIHILVEKAFQRDLSDPSALTDAFDALRILEETDKEEAILCGKESVLALLRGESGKMVCIKRKDSDAYLIETFLNDLEDIANHERHFPKEWIIDERRLSDDFRRYLTPLVDRECQVEYQNGIFLTAKLRFIKA